MDTELGQLARTAQYNARITSIQDISTLLVQSNEEEQERFVEVRTRMLSAAQIIPLTAAILGEAATYEPAYNLSPQDALVLASVITHLDQTRPASACFINRNPRDFDNPDITAALQQYHCRMIFRFDQGLSFIRAQTQT